MSGTRPLQKLRIVGKARDATMPAYARIAFLTVGQVARFRALAGASLVSLAAAGAQHLRARLAGSAAAAITATARALRMTVKLAAAASIAMTTTGAVNDGNAAGNLLLGEQAGLAIDAYDDSMVILDNVTPANNYFGTPGAKLTVTRASTAMQWGSNGVLAQVSNNILRRDFDPRLGGACGYLFEGARTNLLLRSAEFDNAAWSKTSLTITADQSVSPDGNAVMDRLIENGSTSGHILGQSVTVVSGTTYTWTAFFRPGTRRYGILNLAGNGFPATALGLDFQTGTIVNAGLGTPLNGFILPVGNGIYRAGFSLVATASDTAACNIYMSQDGIWANRAYLGDGASYFDIWGAQLEPGAFATSYIPTVAAQATRAADAASIPIASVPFSSLQGTSYARAVLLNTSDTSTKGILVTDANGRLLWRSGPTLRIFDGTTSVGAITAVNPLAPMRVCSSYGGNGQRIEVDGSGTIASGAFDGGMATAALQFGGGIGGPIDGWIMQLMYLPVEKSDSYKTTITSRSGAETLLGVETSGFAIAANDNSCAIFDAAKGSKFIGKPKDKLTITRPSTASFWDKNGVLSIAGNDSLRRDFDPRLGVGVCGFLVEEARTNFLPQSNISDFAAANVTLTPGALSFRGISFTKVQANNTAAAQCAKGVAGIGSAGGNTFSMLVMKGSGPSEANIFGLRNDTTATNLVFFFLNFDTGNISYGTGVSGASAVNLGDGIWLISISVATGISAGDQLAVYSCFSGSTAQAGQYAYVAAAQLEAGMFATSRIPTSGSQVTRSADQVSMPISGLPFSATEGSHWVEYVPVGFSADAILVQFDDGSINNRFLTYMLNVTHRSAYAVLNGGASQAGGNVTTQANAENQSAKQAIGCKQDDFGFVAFGTTLTDTSGLMPTGITHMRIGRAHSAGNFANSWYKSIAYAPRKLTTVELQAKAA